MKRSPSPRGFTIIEVMLFLAITGLMMAGVLFAINGTVNRQRYEDAVTSLTDYFQGQYNSVDNVRSNRPDEASCGASGLSVSGGSQSRGTSDCSIIGRHISTTNGREFISRPVYATVDIQDALSSTAERTERQLLGDLALRLGPADLDEDDERYTVAWSTYAYRNGSETSTNMTVLIVRMPTNGLMRTYVGTSMQIDQLIGNASASQDPFYICVAPDGLVNSPALGAKLLPYAANTSGVQPINTEESRSGACQTA